MRLISASTCVAPSRSARDTGSGSDTEPSIHRLPCSSTGGPATTGIAAVARSAIFHSCAERGSRTCPVRSSAAVAITRSGAPHSRSHGIGLEWAMISSSRWSSDTTGLREPSRRGSANARQAMSSKKMCAEPRPSPSSRAAPMYAPAELP